ncbi:MAG: hypothetical protein K0R80_2153 [Clostridia bacterium]|jgi:hypothetical protein|nr:hypothetical protein [Clostridia bacterium]
MSLTSTLQGKTEKDKKFQDIIKTIINPRPSFTTVSGKKAFSAEYEELVPYSLSNPYYATLVGVGFDYLARFIVANKIKNTNSKRSAVNNLVAGNGLKRLEKITEKRLYDELDKKYKNSVKMCEGFVNDGKSNLDEMLYIAGYLASLEIVARSGMPPQDIKKSLIVDTDIEVINDLRILCNLFENIFISSGILNENSSVIFNPRFGIVSMHCGGADADIFIDGTLYDFKCTKSKGYNWSDCAQIVGYYLLNIIDIRCGGHGIGIDEYGDEYSIDRLAFYRSRYGEIENLEVELLGENKVEQGIEEIRKLWGLKFI